MPTELIRKIFHTDFTFALAGTALIGHEHLRLSDWVTGGLTIHDRHLVMIEEAPVTARCGSTVSIARNCSECPMATCLATVCDLLSRTPRVRLFRVGDIHGLSAGEELAEHRHSPAAAASRVLFPQHVSKS